ETAQLMEGYYALLAEGLAPTQALRHAKLKYLDQVTDPLRAHPFFWAGFVHTGQDAPLSEELSGMWLTVLGVLLAGLMVGVVLYRRIEK
ncbi:MAG TPA: CHAT domain-containing protein, partial [Cytophagales bacterium]|nr:CHAT domain-containing protein [Cytophagales bacterium]